MNEPKLPRWPVRITRDPSGLFATVTVATPEGPALTTMRPDVRAGDAQVREFKRRLAGLARPRAPRARRS